MLLGLIAVTCMLPMLYVRMDEPSVMLNLYKLLAKAGSIGGTVLLAWQFLMGYRGFTGKALPDLLWVLKVHTYIGRFILFLIALHPVFITLYYLEHGRANPLLLEGETAFRAYVSVGMAAFLIFIFVAVTCVFLKSRLSYTWWYIVHVTAYAALPLLFLHSFSIGQTLESTGLRYFWQGLLAFIAVLYVLRFLNWLGVGLGRYRVTEVEHLGPAMIRITCSVEKRPIEPQTGQFVYFRRGLWSQGRPYTVSQYDRQTGKLSISVKAQGKSSSGLLSIQLGERVFVEGPFGVFMQKAMESQRPLVLIAGGIGITPFYRLLDEHAGKNDREMHLFYGNKCIDEIAYQEEIEEVSDQAKPVRVTHVLSEEEQFEGEKGFISIALLKKNLRRDLSEYEYLLCGPPAMIDKLKAELITEGIKPEHIHYELFSV